MFTVHYAKRAEADVDEIAVYTMDQLGPAQTRQYILGLREFCRLLAEKPLMGRAFDDARPNSRRMEHASHVILYKVTRTGITIQRILHKSRLLPAR